MKPITSLATIPGAGIATEIPEDYFPVTLVSDALRPDGRPKFIMVLSVADPNAAKVFVPGMHLQVGLQDAPAAIGEAPLGNDDLPNIPDPRSQAVADASLAATESAVGAPPRPDVVSAAEVTGDGSAPAGDEIPEAVPAGDAPAPTGDTAGAAPAEEPAPEL